VLQVAVISAEKFLSSKNIAAVRTQEEGQKILYNMLILNGKVSLYSWQ
jgi:hypothetical protein